MKICGLQKLTALDFPGRIACTVFTPGCNFRCPFCHNAALVTEMPELMDGEEVFAYLEKRRGILDGVVITGGEPMLQSGLADFLRRVKAMGYLVKLDTNGSFPEKLEPILAEKLVDYVAMDIKNSPDKYGMSCGCSVDMGKIKKSVELIKRSGVDYEFRTTAVEQLHEEADFRAMGEIIKGAKRWYIQKFVDSGGLITEGLSAASNEKMERWCAVAREYAECAQLRGA